MSRRRRSPRGRVRSEDLPALVEFARGYLHEDMLVEHGGVLAALRAYLADVGPADRTRLGSELARLVDAGSGWTGVELARFFTVNLGAAWAPASIDELRTLESAVRDYRAIRD